MLRLIVHELLKRYKKPIIRKLSHYFANFLAAISLIILIVTNYVYQHGEYKYISGLLITSTVLLAITLSIKLILAYLNKPRIKKNDASMDIVSEAMPLLIRILPVGIMALAIWSATKELKEKYLHELGASPKE